VLIEHRLDASALKVEALNDRLGPVGDEEGRIVPVIDQVDLLQACHSASE
jgi:hypothetical protein